MKHLPSPFKHKHQEAEVIKDQVQEFIAKGHKIEKVPVDNNTTNKSKKGTK